MRTWYFSEMAYHPAWEKGLARVSLRVNFPSENVDPGSRANCSIRYLFPTRGDTPSRRNTRCASVVSYSLLVNAVDRGGERIRLFPVRVMARVRNDRHRGVGDFRLPCFAVRRRNDPIGVAPDQLCRQIDPV